jgi:hypothetical protein
MGGVAAVVDMFPTVVAVAVQRMVLLYLPLQLLTQ